MDATVRAAPSLGKEPTAIDQRQRLMNMVGTAIAEYDEAVAALRDAGRIPADDPALIPALRR